MVATDTSDIVATAGRHALPYRTAFEVALSFADASDRVREQLRSWLRDKGYDVTRFDHREVGIGNSAALYYLMDHTVCGWQLREERSGGVTWVSTVSVTRGDRAGGRDSSWISVDVRALSETGDAPTPAPPRLVRLLLDTLDARDDEAVLRSCPVVVDRGQVDDLLEDVVCAEARRLPVVVAAAPADRDFEQWKAHVNSITWDLPGLASIYLLNPRAVSAFNHGIGPTHWVGPGAIRTYLTDVDPAVTEDAVRHRVLSPRRVENDARRARRLIAILPRRLAANSLPSRAARVLDLSFRDFAHERGAGAATAGDVEARLADWKALLQLAETEKRQLQATVGELQEQVLDLASELEVTQKELVKKDDLVISLQERLKKSRLYAAAYTPAETKTDLPTSLGDLLDRMDELRPHVVFSGDPEPCLDLDEHTQNSTWAQTAWRAMLALRDYASAKQNQSFKGDFKRWCESPPSGGRPFSPGKVATGESGTVRHNKRLAAMRTFPVPSTVHPEGKMFMAWHIRLGQQSTVAPRLYFHDDTSRTGTVYIGYIGRHLPNTMTT